MSGLGAFGQRSVERVLEIMNRELQIVMMQRRATNLPNITAASLQL